MWLVGSQSVVWFSNFTKTYKLSFMKRGTKILCDEWSRFSDHFAHPMPSEQAGLWIWMIIVFVFHRKYTRNPSKTFQNHFFKSHWSHVTILISLKSRNFKRFLWNHLLVAYLKIFSELSKTRNPLVHAFANISSKASRDGLRPDQAPPILYFRVFKNQKKLFWFTILRKTQDFSRKITLFKIGKDPKSPKVRWNIWCPNLWGGSCTLPCGWLFRSLCGSYSIKKEKRLILLFWDQSRQFLSGDHATLFGRRLIRW